MIETLAVLGQIALILFCVYYVVILFISLVYVLNNIVDLDNIMHEWVNEPSKNSSEALGKRMYENKTWYRVVTLIGVLLAMPFVFIKQIIKRQ